MARYREEFFNIKIPVYVRKKFTGNGRIWLPGMLFDWNHYAVSPNRVRSLFRSSYLTHDEPEFLGKDEPQTVEAAAQVSSILTPSDTEYTIEHKAGPYYNVVNGSGVVVNDKALHKSKAEALALELSGDVTD